MIKTKSLKFFNFKNNIGNILFFRRHSNLFLVLLDRRKRHVVTLTSGFCKLGTTKKQKVAPLNMIGIIQKLKLYLSKYNIKFINLYIKQRLSFFYHHLRKLFKLYDVKINEFIYLLKRAHGKKRGRKLRRI